MTRKALDPNLASILDSIRATVGADLPPPVAQAVDIDEPLEDAVEIEVVAEEAASAEEARPARATKAGRKAAAAPAAGRTVEDFLADLIRPQVEAWLNANLPELVQKMAAEEIARLTGKK
ncbi:DUF2497 domain-containing protein [Sandaracinobacter sp. RS1-74]|uniref:DUF2497 domain-containing protein n=1 Tax=Sandaracinobacteroides sayramensis TaxID=2913411 RepID=UPI001EDC00B3|nr:DUF2497 domain-containing protein [Sandaracinobacteroides sayramensis]MCG2840366.1 DUF2497 domain-containing protein [Sandaracinobacteroides sayramensis]